MAWAFSEGRNNLNTDALMESMDVLAEAMKHLAKGQVDGSDAEILEGSRILSALLAECGMEVPLSEAEFYAFLKAVGPALVDEQALETPPEDTDASHFVMNPVLARIMELTNCTLSHQFDLSVAGLHALCKTAPQISSVSLNVKLPEAGGSVSELEGKIEEASAVSDAADKSTVSAVAQFLTEEELFEKDQVYYLEYTLTSVGQKIPEDYSLTVGGQAPAWQTAVSYEKGVYTVSAVWRFVIGEPASYQVSFDANGHGQAPEAVEVTAGTILRYELENLDQENQAEGEDLFALKTWRDASGTSWEDVCVESDVTLTAEWVKLLTRIDITFAVPHAGEDCPAPVVPEDAVYHVADWYVLDEQWADITELEAGKKYIVTVNLAVDEDAEIYLERFEFEDIWEDYLGTCYINGELQEPGVGGYNIHYENRAFEISFKFEPLGQEGGDTVNGDATGNEVVLSFDSFDGGGPEYTVTIEDETVATYKKAKVYRDENHDEMNGAAFDIKVTVTALAPGETLMTVVGSSPITGEEVYYYKIRVEEDLSITVTSVDGPDEGGDPDDVDGPDGSDGPDDVDDPNGNGNPDDVGGPEDLTYSVVVTIGNRSFVVEMEHNSSAEALVEKLKTNMLKLNMSDYGNFEKVANLPWELPTNDESITTVPGDVILYQGNKLTIYYDENTWEFTRIGHISGVTQDELKSLLGDGDVTVEFWLEWSE